MLSKKQIIFATSCSFLTVFLFSVISGAVLGGCKSCNTKTSNATYSQDKEEKIHSNRKTPPPRELAPPRPRFEKTVPSPTKITILNDTKQTRVFDVTFSDADPFWVTRLDGPFYSDINLSRCICECGGPVCPEFARPPTRKITLAPQKSTTYNWNGRFTRHTKHPKSGDCCEVFDPPAGRYVFTACSDDKQCARKEITLPTKETITISLSAKAEASECASVNMKLATRTAKYFRARLGSALKKRPVEKCVAPPRCVEPEALATQIKGARKNPCTFFVIPRGNEVELRAFMPLPKTHVGGENYSRFYDPDFTRPFRVEYEQ